MMTNNLAFSLIDFFFNLLFSYCSVLYLFVFFFFLFVFSYSLKLHFYFLSFPIPIINVSTFCPSVCKLNDDVRVNVFIYFF
jgi:hypothetical protein